jgi:hypothetical protein
MPQEVNPYQPPVTDCSASGETVLFHARYLPRDAIDVAIGLPLGIVGAAVVYGLPALAFYLAGFELSLAVVSSVLLMLGPLIVLGMCGLESVRLEPGELQLRRHWRSVVAVPWTRLKGIRLASRGETLQAMATRPPWTCMMGMSYRDHCRIDWEGGHAHFAPRNPELFLELVREQIARNTGVNESNVA